MWNPRSLAFAVLGVLLLTPPARPEPVDPCADCAKKGWPVDLLPGTVRLALPSPDGSRLAILGGPGSQSRKHAVVVVARDCAAGIVQKITLTADAPFPEEPKELPVPYVRLQWSPDGEWLYALDGVYRITRDPQGNLAAKRTRTLPHPFLDFRFGPGDRVVAIEVPEARKRKARADGEELFTVTLNYVFVNRVRDLTQAITPPDRQMGFWVPRIWEGPPAVDWDTDGAAILAYPFEDFVERFLPGKVRGPAEVRPAPRVRLEGRRFETHGDCRTTWELAPDKTSDRIKVRIE
jgi:hypothetical protein